MPQSSLPIRGHSLGAHFLLATLAMLTVLASAGYIFAVAFLKAGPVLDRNRLTLHQSIRILDRTGGVLYEFSNAEHRLYLQQNDIPDRIKQAIVAIEDERFFQRKTCIDIRAILRALKVNTLEGGMQGASTITQQLVRMLYLSQEQTITRKTYEILLSCRLEYLLSKDEILTLYLNGVSFGNGINGIEAASKAYFGKPASALTLAETATLVSIPQRPTYFSPYGPNLRTHVEPAILHSLRRGTLSGGSLPPLSVSTGLLPMHIRTRTGMLRIGGRSDFVLQAMLRLSMIDQKAFDAASKELLRMTFKPLRRGITAPHFTLKVRREVESLLDSLDAPTAWEAAGLSIRTTLDPVLQQLAEQVILESQDALTLAFAKNVALVAIDRKTREIVAYVGNNDFFASNIAGQIDMATVPRQPGSSFKPLVYATAFERGLTPESIVQDAPLRIGSDMPKNYEGGYRGPMTIRQALSQSRNIPAIRTFLAVGGEDAVLEAGYRAGITTPLVRKQKMLQKNPHFTYGWPMAIGSVDIPLLEMVQLYATIANHGLLKPLQALCSIRNAQEKTLLKIPLAETKIGIDRQAADAVDEILRDSKSKPEGFWRTMLTIPNLETGAKTGTSNVCFQRDIFHRCTEYGVNNVWTMGYSPDLVVGVWVGNADNSVLDPLADGLTVAAPIWRMFLERASKQYKTAGSLCESSV